MADERTAREGQPEHRPAPAGQYYLMEKVAQGGMAEIFKGLSYDVHGIKKTVCIKKILPQIAASQEFIDSLIDEAKVAVSLSHGNIAQVYDLGKVGDDYFMVMEFVEGRSLSQINKRCLKQNTLAPIPYLCYVIAEILNGLNYIHRRTDERGRPLGIVHRDISPQNIMVSYSGTVKIIDFGIAKSKIRMGTTDSGILKGKFAYMSPEQARGDPIDHRSDIFSLGVIFHEMLTGRRLFKADDNRQTLKNVRRSKVDTPSDLRPDLPPELDEIVMRALSKDRRERYPFASEMHDELVKFLYTTYPDFKPSDIAAFVTELFRDQLPKPGETKEAGTPYLIIDHTSSAIQDRAQFEDTGIARAPVDMEPYMVGQQPPSAEEATPPEGSVSRQEGPSESEEKRGAAKHARSLVRTVTAGAAAAILVAGLIIGTWYWFTRPEAPREPPPPTGQLLVTTTPADAEVYVDGDLVGSGSPVTVSDIVSGTPHMLTVQRDGFMPQTRRFTLEPDEFRDLAFMLTPEAVPTSTIAVSSSPPGATIFLDDQKTKYRTPATITDIEPGTRHELGLHLPNHRYWSTNFTTRANETQNFHVQLAIDFGSLRVTSEPRGALVIVNDAPAGQTPLTVERLEPGATYRVEIWHEGYETQRHEVRIPAGKLEELHLTLEKGRDARPSPATPAKPPAPPSGPSAPSEAPSGPEPMGPAGF